MPRNILNGLFAVAAVCAFFVLLRVVWSPDPTQNLFATAQRLETAGQIPSALRAYELISETHPESFYAPRSLLRQGDLLASEGRQSGDRKAFMGAVRAYSRLAAKYAADPLSTEALLDAGKISAENLNDRGAAKGFYNQILEKAGSKSDAAATATLKLGCLAMQDKDGKTAQKLLQLVLQRWPSLSDRAAEAQYNLGVTYETLFKNKDWALRAYDATITRYPSSTWANDARGRIGLITYNKPVRPVRRVLIDIEPLPDDGGANGSLWASLRPILAARGIEADEATLRAWSLLPFYAAFDPQNPSRVVKASFDPFENVLANAGLRFTVKSGGTEAGALGDLQDEIDAARAPLVYFEEKGQGKWALCVGYDSDRGEVMLQSRGARFDTLAAKAFAGYWKAKSSLGGPYTLISMLPRDAKAKPAPSLTPSPTATLKPNQTPLPALLAAPEFVWELQGLNIRDSDQRVLARASTMLGRPREGGALLNAEGLNALAVELARISHGASDSVVPEPEAIATEVPDASPTPEGGTPAPESPYTPDSTPAATPVAIRKNDMARAKALLGFFGGPARQWAMSRREGAAWCEDAANRLNKPELKRAAEALRQSASALEAAILLVPSLTGDRLGAGDRSQIGEVAAQVEKARDAERAAAKLMR